MASHRPVVEVWIEGLGVIYSGPPVSVEPFQARIDSATEQGFVTILTHSVSAVNNCTEEWW